MEKLFATGPPTVPCIWKVKDWQSGRDSCFIFARDLISTLRTRELDETATRIVEQTGLTHQPSKPGDPVAGIYRERIALASGRFAMLDNGMGFELVPWRPALDKHLGQSVSGHVKSGGGIEWTLGRGRGHGI